MDIEIKSYGSGSKNPYEEKDFWQEYSITWGQALNLAYDKIGTNAEKDIVVKEAKEIFKTILLGKLDKENLNVFQKYWNIKHNKKVEEKPQ